MLELADVNTVVKKAASSVLKRKAAPRRVFSEPTVGHFGDDMLRITLVLNPGVAENLSGDKAVDMIFQIAEALRRAGEDRLPVVFVATEEELAAVDDPES